jgi:tRNA A37 N6-isopentenylltransferase MiaA
MAAALLAKGPLGTSLSELLRLTISSAVIGTGTKEILSTLQLNPPELYERINARVDEMMAEGLLKEAEQFYPHKQLNTLNTVGYKELYEYMDGNWTLDFAINMIKQDSRRYTKRQLTWFNRDKEIRWFVPEDEEDILEYVKNLKAGGPFCLKTFSSTDSIQLNEVYVGEVWLAGGQYFSR